LDTLAGAGHAFHLDRLSPVSSQRISFHNVWQYRLTHQRSALSLRLAFWPGILAYLNVDSTAPNTWLDLESTARDASLNNKVETASLGDLLPDPKSLQAEQSKLLQLDIEEALAKLTPLFRDALWWVNPARKSDVATHAPSKPSQAGCERRFGK